MIGIQIFCFIVAILSLISFTVSGIKKVKSFMILFLISYVVFWGLFVYSMYLEYSYPNSTYVRDTISNNINNKGDITSEGSVPPTKNTPNTSSKPESKPRPEHYGEIVANTDSKIYHMPGGAYYDKSFEDLTNNVYFKTEQEAINAGYRKSTR